MSDEYIKELQLLNAVRLKCNEKPEFLNKVIQAGTQGIMEKEKQMREMAADMETAASAAISLLQQERVSKKLKEQMGNLVLSKLQKYAGKSFMRWDDSVKSKI